MRGRLAWLPTVLLVLCLAVIVWAGDDDSGVESAQLQTRIDSLVTQQKYPEALALLDRHSQRSNPDEEERQYSLLTSGEIYLFYLSQPDDAVGSFKTLIADYHADSPYVATARYHLGSLYMDQGDPVQSFSNLAHVPASSPHYTDAQTKLDWATRNLRNVVRLPFGWQIGVGRLGGIALLADAAFTALWVTQAILSKGKNKKMWVVLILLAAVKILISYQFMGAGH